MRRISVFRLGGTCLAALTTLGGGCSALLPNTNLASPHTESPAATTNTKFPDDDVPPDQQLDEAEARVIRDTFRDLAGTLRPEPPDPPPPPATRPIWPAFDDAIAAAGGQPGVEVVVVRSMPVPDGRRYELRTINDRPGWLHVRQVTPDQFMIDSAFGWVPSTEKRAVDLMRGVIKALAVKRPDARIHISS